MMAVAAMARTEIKNFFMGLLTSEEIISHFLYGELHRVGAHQGVDIGVALGAVVNDGPVAQSNDALDLVHKGEFVGGHHQGGAVGCGLVEQGEEGFLAGGIEADEGFVDKQQLERADEGDGDRCFLAQAA